MSHRICTGISRSRLGKLIEELAGPWLAQQESRLRERRGHARLRAEGAGPAHELPFADRVIATLVVLRFQLPHAALALFYQVDRSTITRAVHEIRPLLADRTVEFCQVIEPDGDTVRLNEDPSSVLAAITTKTDEGSGIRTGRRATRRRSDRPAWRAGWAAGRRWS